MSVFILAIPMLRPRASIWTNDPDPIVGVSLSGTGALAGDTLQLYNGTGTGSPLGSPYTLNSTDIDKGFANVQPGTLTDGTTYTLTAWITDAAGQSVASTNSFTVTEDTTPPTLTPIANQLDQPTGPNGAVATFAATATDIIDGTDPVAFTEGNKVVHSGDTFSIGRHTIARLTQRATRLPRILLFSSGRTLERW
jgi:hypothetical protein